MSVSTPVGLKTLVSRRLGAKHTRSNWIASKRSPGWGHFTRGFFMDEHGNTNTGGVWCTVGHRPHEHVSGRDFFAEIEASLGTYAETLRAAGFNVDEWRTHDADRRLTGLFVWMPVAS